MTRKRFARPPQTARKEFLTERRECANRPRPEPHTRRLVLSSIQRKALGEAPRPRAEFKEIVLNREDHAGTGIGSVEIGRELWVVVLPSAVDALATSGLRDALVSALDRGARSIVVDFVAVGAIAADALDVLSSVSQTLLARGGCLWLANLAATQSFPIVAVDRRGLGPLAGLNAALDAALFADAAPAHTDSPA